jgi:hypothetical protein
MIFASAKFFLFLVDRNSADFGPARPRKSFVAHQFVSGSGAKLSEFRPGGGAKLKLPPGGALFGKMGKRTEGDTRGQAHFAAHDHRGDGGAASPRWAA